MLKSRWDPSTVWEEMRQFQNGMNRLFDSYGREGRALPGLTSSYPALNVWEDGESLHAEAELPGMNLEDLEIYVTGGDQLTIKGERKLPGTPRGVWHRRERGFGNFVRVLTLPVDVDADRVEAKFAHGVLTITLPKSVTAKARKIAVKAE